MAYITAAHLRAALNPGTYLAIFDDDNTGNLTTVDASTGVTLCINRAHAQVTSYLQRIYDVAPAELPSAVPILLASAELDFAVAYAFERHPEYVRTFGENPRAQRWQRAQETMERIADAIQQIAPNDTPPEAQPRTVGGLHYDGGRRIIVDSPDGTFNGGDF